MINFVGKLHKNFSGLSQQRPRVSFINVMKLRKATYADADACLAVLEYGRLSQRESGFVQWPDGYPSAENVTADIDNGLAYVLEDTDGTIAAYTAIAFADSEYDRLSQLWTPVDGYAVFHRVAVGRKYRHTGTGRALFAAAEELAKMCGARAVRIDTGVPNLPMQRLLDACGYTRCCHAQFCWGERYAYQKLL